MEQKTTARSSQNLLDICLQEKGGIASVFQLSDLNNISITDALTSGSNLDVSIDVADLDILNYYKKELIMPATGNPDKLEVEVLQGIGYWAIGVDFRIG